MGDDIGRSENVGVGVKARLELCEVFGLITIGGDAFFLSLTKLKLGAVADLNGDLGKVENEFARFTVGCCVGRCCVGGCCVGGRRVGGRCIGGRCVEE